MATTTHRGACHCGAVRFRADLDLAEIETSRCNCSICLKGRFWKAVIPAEAFALEAGDEALATYRFGEGKIDHRFCTTCGVKTFGRVTLDGSDFVAINVAC